jgi:hypothetical protein
MSHARLRVGCAVVTLASLATIIARAQPASSDTTRLAEGPHASMHASLERTIFKVDVLSLDIRVDPRTQLELRALAQGHDYSALRADRIVGAVLQADNALVHVRFEHDISVARYLREAETQLRLAARSGMMPRDTADAAVAAFSRLLALLGERGFEDGDVLVYRVRPDSVRVLVRADDDRILLDRTIDDPRASRAVLGSYFAPDSPFREELVRSLFR